MAVTEAQRQTMLNIETGEDFDCWLGDFPALYAHRTKSHVLPVNYRTVSGDLVCLRIGTSGNRLAPKFSA